MAIHAKANGLLIGGKVIDETDKNWIFQAMDNKRPTVVSKTDERNRAFTGDCPVDEAIAWQDAARRKTRHQ